MEVLLSSGDLGGDAEGFEEEEEFLLRIGEPVRDLTKTGEVRNL